MVSNKYNIFENSAEDIMGQILFYDILILLLFAITIALSAYFLHKSAVKDPKNKEISRKYLHIIACSLCTLAAAFIHNTMLLAMATGISLIPLFYLVFKKNFFSKGAQKSYGIIYFPIIFIFLILAFSNQQDRWLIIAPMGFLAFSDGLAALIGIRYSKKYFNLTGEKKSILGTTSFVIVGCIWMIALRILGFQNNEPFLEYFLFSIIVTLLAAGSEIMGSYGRDNLFVPAVTAFVIWAYTNAPMAINIYDLSLIFLLFSLAALLAWKMKMLNGSGAIMSALMGIFILGFGHFSIWPLLAFFATSSLLGKIPKTIKSDAKDGKPRDYIQVLSNGGVAMLLAGLNCIFQDPDFYLLYLISVAVSTSDTWSSEIGMRLSKKALDVRTIKLMPAGLSGCISMPGIIAAAAGAIMIALFSGSISAGIIVALFGFSGSLLDSVLGALFQARYSMKSGSVVSDFGNDKPISGYEWMTNDRVNILSNIIITGTAAAYLL